jgi:hypothetical protein
MAHASAWEARAGDSGWHESSPSCPLVVPPAAHVWHAEAPYPHMLLVWHVGVTTLDAWWSLPPSHARQACDAWVMSCCSPAHASRLAAQGRSNRDMFTLGGHSSGCTCPPPPLPGTSPPPRPCPGPTSPACPAPDPSACTHSLTPVTLTRLSAMSHTRTGEGPECCLVLCSVPSLGHCLLRPDPDPYHVCDAPLPGWLHNSCNPHVPISGIDHIQTWC